MSASKQENPKEDVATYCALHVALQTLKERCLTLQERLVVVENENINFKREAEVDSKSNSLNNEQNGRSEIELLRMKVNELTRQKTQLNEHISMIATENRQLWQRLTKLTKDGQNAEDIQAIIKDMTSSTTSTHQNLGKAEFEKKCGEIIPATNVQPNLLGFGYLNDEIVDADLQIDTKKCLDGMSEIKKELLRQQSDLKVALSSLRQRKVLEICSTCRANPKKPATADKIIETEDILTHRLDDKSMITKTITDENSAQIDFYEEKRVADCIDKMCPMCGKIYNGGVKFDEFQDHVESHFIDDSELETSMERNYEIISHAVGNF